MDDGEEEMDMVDSEEPVRLLHISTRLHQNTGAADSDSDAGAESDEEDFGEEDDGDGDDDPSFGDAPKPKAPKSGPPKHIKKSESKMCSTALTAALQQFPSKRATSVSSDEDYAAKSHKKKFFQRSGANSRGTATPDTSFGDSDAPSWRRGAARKIVTYNEASVDYGLDSEGDDDVMYYNDKEAPIGKLQATITN
jgi:chromodomain-helicase-DNA-binding protein 1